MTKEIALAKLMWAFGQFKSNKRVKEIFATVPQLAFPGYHV